MNGSVHLGREEHKLLRAIVENTAAISAELNRLANLMEKSVHPIYVFGQEVRAVRADDIDDDIIRRLADNGGL